MTLTAFLARVASPTRPAARVPAAGAAAAVIAASVVVSLCYLWAWCPHDLSPDEAHYWDWSRHLDWSYYSKGPLVAWLVRAGCELFGPLSVSVTGDLGAAVRTPAVVCHAALLAGWYVLAAGVFRSPRLGLAVLVCAAPLPMVRAGAVLMTIDPPFMACWCWALICVWRGLDTGRSAWWAGAGVLTATGILAKYTMALFPAAVVGYLLFHRRSEFRRPGVYLLLAGAALGWVPVIAWNAANDWVSFRHVFGLVGAGGGRPVGLRWDGLGSFAGGQLGMLFGAWLVAFVGAGVRFRPAREPDPAVRLLWWVSAPVWLLFAAASLVKPGQPNWPAPAYVAGFVLAVAWAGEQLRGPRPRLAAWAVVLTSAAALAVTAALYFPGLVRPAVGELAGPPTATRPFPARQYDLTARLVGWKELAAAVDEVRTRVRFETGEEPVIVGTHWTHPGVIAFYLSGRPQVYSVGTANVSDRYSQYDVWRPNPVADAQAFRGRAFVLVGDVGPDTVAAFDRVDPPVRVVFPREGAPVAGWNIQVGHGFRGYPRAGAGNKY
ncbi:MAG: hypothetical protein C0501_29155 [Isosphaera sp.]|nr:hypothetical protein [Isosphaera sp.]